MYSLLTLLFSLASQPTCNESIKKEIYVDSRDGQKYKTVLIHGQKWFAQNLNYSSSSLQGNVCAFSNADSCKFYGRSYSWYSANQVNVCPSGYHLPSSKEFDTLIKNTGGKISGINMKATSGFPMFYHSDPNGVDSYGWCGLPNRGLDASGNPVTGCTIKLQISIPGYYLDYTYTGCTGNEYYWTKDGNADIGIRYLIGHGVFDFTGGGDPKNKFYSVRCINDTDFSQQYLQSIKRDTVKIQQTVIKKDTVRIKDTVVKTKIDTVKIQQTVIKKDTIRIKDTIVETKTKIEFDTITMREIVNGFKESDKFYYEKLYSDFGKPTKSYSGITFNGVDDSGSNSTSPTIQIHTNIKTNVRIFVYDNMGTFVDKEEYNLSENKYYYFYFNGYNSIRQKVVNGVYLIRVLTTQNNKSSNTVYKVGIKND